VKHLPALFAVMLVACTGGGTDDTDRDDVTDPHPDAFLFPGAELDVGEPPCANIGDDDDDHGCVFDTEPPAHADGVRCSTGQWWQQPGDEEEGEWMRPGNPCISCHADSGDEDAPSLSWGGTVFGGQYDENECRGIPGVQVEILDEANEVLFTTTTNQAGNFLVHESQQAFERFRIRLTLDGRTREMASHQGIGDCNSCHTAEGTGGAPGRIVAP